MSDLELMRERYLDLALEGLTGDHSALTARIVAAAKDGPADDFVALAPVIALPTVSRWTAVRPWLQAACLVVALGLIGWLIVQRTTPPELPKAEPLPEGVRGFAGSKHHHEGKKAVLDEGVFTLENGAPEVSAADHSLRDCSGRVVLSIGAATDDAFLTQLIPLFASESLSLTKKEEAMLRSIKRWSINGALALCVLSGSVVMDGNTLEVEAQDDAVEEMAADYFNASDTNKDGKVTWNEMLAREREYKAAGRKQMSEEQRKAFNARYEFVIEREMFLHADADDNLEVTLAEYTKFLMDAQKEDATEPAYTDKDARQLAVVNLDEQWDGLLSDADANNDKKLQHQEIRDHFLLDEVKRGGRINPDGTKEEWEEGVDEDISEAFAAADANKDKALDKAEYAEFMALEYKAGDERFLIYADQTPDRRDDRTTGETKVPPIKLTRGSTMFFKEMTSLHKDPRTGQWTRELQYKVVTIEKASALGFQGHSIRVDASKKRIEDGDGSYNRGWPKGFDQDKFKLETLKISGVDYVCGYNEYEVPRQQTINDEKVGGEGMKKVQVWHLRGLPGLEVKRIDDGVVTFELLELNIKK